MIVVRVRSPSRGQKVALRLSPHTGHSKFQITQKLFLATPYSHPPDHLPKRACDLCFS